MTVDRPVRLGMVSQWFAPERGSAAIATVIAKQLQASGFDLHVITGLPNYPTGRIYPGYRVRPAYPDLVDGVLVRRVPLYANHEPRAIPRMANYLSFAASATLDAQRHLADRDVVLVHGTPGTAALPAMALKKTRGIPYVLHVHDLWPDTVTASGFIPGRAGQIAESALHHFVDESYRLADHIAVTSSGMVDRVLARGVPQDKVSVIHNWADEQVFRPIARDARLAAELGITRLFNLFYAGNLGRFRNFPPCSMPPNICWTSLDIGVVMIGDGSDRVAARRRPTSVTQRCLLSPNNPWIEWAPSWLWQCAFRGPDGSAAVPMTMPSKLQATLAAGRPVIGALAGDAAATIKAAGAGAVVSVNEGSQIAHLVRSWRHNPDELAQMAARARNYYVGNLSSSVSAAALTEVLTKAADGGRSRR